jgi:hypothetical protein
MMAARKIDPRRAERGSLPTKLLSCGFQSANKSLIKTTGAPTSIASAKLDAGIRASNR